MSDPRIHLFGIRHHGPGSARALLAALTELEPDTILVEGPDDANHLLHWLEYAEMEPPVALILYKVDDPQRAAFFPFARFSPEYQALRFGLQRRIPTRFCDLPQRHMLAARVAPGMPGGAVLQALAAAGGFGGYESWWNHLVEQRSDAAGLFEATHELMIAARAVPASDGRAEPDDADAATRAAATRLAEQREAYMRHVLRAALDSGAQRVAVVCGAWHSPALADPDTAVADDDTLLAGLPAVEIDGAWVPWTYGRLSAMGGYGAGVLSPGWYDHLWACHDTAPHQHARRVSSGWLSAIATLLRAEGYDVSAAHVIESVRLAEATAALRDRALPGLEELNEAALAVMCHGDRRPMQVIQRRLVIGERMGRVPADAPMTPLQRDLQAQQTHLRLQPQPDPVRLDLDLRVELHLARSRLLHRLRLLEINWGTAVQMRRTEHSHRERWTLHWQPGIVANVVAASAWGNTVADAAAAWARDRADKAEQLVDLTSLLDEVILAELPDLVQYIMARIEEQGVLHTDVPLLMDALPPLVRILRYGSIRRVDQGTVQHAVDVMLTRICVGLPEVCRNVNDDAAEDMVTRLQHIHALVGTLRNQVHAHRWRAAVREIAEDRRSQPLVAGRSVRLLLDSGDLSHDIVAARLAATLDRTHLDAGDLRQMGQWLDGFLRGADTLLVRDEPLWTLVDGWIAGLDAAQFMLVLPLLRRAFAAFGSEARAALLARVRRSGGAAASALQAGGFDPARAALVMPTLSEILHADPAGGCDDTHVRV